MGIDEPKVNFGAYWKTSKTVRKRYAVMHCNITVVVSFPVLVLALARVDYIKTMNDLYNLILL